MRAFHIPSTSGNLAAIYHAPRAGTSHLRDLLLLHGFAHEHNITRPILASIARRLADNGTGVLLIDLPGCGDSAGEFGDVTWESWRCAVCAAHRWLTVSSTRPIHVGGLRLGAVLALESAEQIAWKSILLLQPVIRGEEMVTQFLRVRVAFSGLRGDSTEKETTQKLRTRIAAGEKLEIGGFFLSPELAMAVDSIDLGARMPPTGCQIHWVETGRGEGSPASRSTVDRWHAAGAAISLSHVDVKPYWVHTRGLVQEYEPLVDEVARILGETAR